MKNKVLIVNFVLLVLTICQSCSSYHALSVQYQSRDVVVGSI